MSYTTMYERNTQHVKPSWSGKKLTVTKYDYAFVYTIYICFIINIEHS